MHVIINYGCNIDYVNVIDHNHYHIEYKNYHLNRNYNCNLIKLKPVFEDDIC